MKLGFHYHIPAVIIDGAIKTPAYQGLFIDSLANHFDEIILFLYSVRKVNSNYLDYTIVSNNVRLVTIGKRRSIPLRLILHYLDSSKILNRLFEMDAVLIRAPTPLLPYLSKKLSSHKAIIFLLVGKLPSNQNEIPFGVIKTTLITAFNKWNEKKQKKYAKSRLVLCNSVDLLHEYQKISDHTRLVRTTTISKSDLYYNEKKVLTSPVKLLYTGRITWNKGLLDILEALHLLRTEKLHFVWDIVGWAQPKDPAYNQLKQRIIELNLEDRVKFHGRKKVGKEIFEYYKKADLYLMASFGDSEGFPRTITEAMANSLPVVCTPVGSIPMFHTDNHDIVFAKPRDPRELADKIMKVISDSKFRQKIVVNAYNNVQNTTLEKQSEIMVSYIKDCVSSD